MAERLCEVAPLAVRFPKQMFHKGRWVADHRTTRDVTENLAAQCMKSEDMMERINAFLEKRKPLWKRR